MAVNLGSAVAYLDLDTKGFEAGVGKFKSAMQTMQSDSAKFSDKMQAAGGVITSIGATATKTLTVPIVGGLTAAVKSASDFESAFTGVRKTVDATKEEYAELAQGITEMSERMPQSASQIAAVMEIAGQLGVRGTDNLLTFTETMIKLGDSTNLSSEEAATAIARIMNIMGDEAPDAVERYGSAIVELGNNYATTESDVVAMTNRLAAGGKIAGLTTPEIMALATAMSSVGIEAEAGGTAMVQTFNEIEKAVATGGDKLDLFAKTANMTSEEFATNWKTKPIEAIEAFITGLGKVEENGGNTVLLLEDLGLTGIRQSNMLKSLAAAGDLLGNTLETANSAWQDNTALTEEASKRYETFDSQLQMFWNTLVNVAREIGEIILPYLQEFLDWIKEAIQKFHELDEPTKEMIVKAGLIVAAIGPLLVVFGNVVKLIGSVKTAIDILIPVIGGLTSPIALVIGAIGALAAAYATNFGGFRDKINEFVEWLSELFGSWFEEHETLLSSWFETIKEAFSAFWEGIEALFSGAIDLILGLLKGLIQIATGDVEGGLQTILSGVESFWQNLFNALGKIVEGIIKILVQLIATVYVKAKEIITNFWKGCKEIWANVKAWFELAKEDPVKAFTQLIDALRNVGRKIIEGLLSGFKSAFTAVKNWVLSAVDWIRNTWDRAVGAVSTKSAKNFGKSKGHFATGLDYVPRTMQVTVHEGERILSKQQNRDSSNGANINVYINAEVANDYDVDRLGNKLGKAIRNQIRSTGGGLAWS